MRQNIIIKISGDLIANQNALNFIKELTKIHYVVVIVGGGTFISKKLNDNGYWPLFDNNGTRIHPDNKSRKIARNVLEDIELEVQDKLIGAHVITPYLYIGRVLCHINGDDMLDLLAPSFDDAYCLTLEGRYKEFKNERIKIKYVGEKEI